MKKQLFYEKIIIDLVCNSEKNRLSHIDNNPIFDEPIVGFADGNDKLFIDYKKIIGAFHHTPREILQKHFPNWKSEKDSCSVISWILPISKETKESNAAMSDFPSERWAHTKLYGEELNIHLRRKVVETLLDSGFYAVAPILSLYYSTRYSPDIASSWSERHISYAAGLGTFSLSDGLITSKGVAMRCGSVVTNLEVDPTPRKYHDYQEYCLYFNSGTCGQCIYRCPADAIGVNGHDKVKCRHFVNVTSGKYVSNHYGVEVECCGLCQTGVPCESKIPVK
jgi:epoxyqueuosine reductase QueG